LNIEWERIKKQNIGSEIQGSKKDEETEIAAGSSVGDICFSFDVGRWTLDVHLSKSIFEVNNGA
jgi:hypothetical protein